MTFFASFYSIVLVELLIAQVVSAVIFQNFIINFSLLLGWILSVLPFASWHLTIKITKGFQEKKNRLLAVVIGVGKYAFIVAAVLLAVKFNMIEPLSLFIGLIMAFPAVLLVNLFKPRFDNVR